jgi:hypothetical protein
MSGFHVDDEEVARWEAERDERYGTTTADPSSNGSGPIRTYEIGFDEKGRLVLPKVPAVHDIAGLCSWLTSVFNLNPVHPILGGAHQGLAGPEGHVHLRRQDAPAIRFEPASKINAPGKLIETLSWRMIPTDGAVHDLKGGHCRQVAHVVRMLCGATKRASDEQNTAGIVGAFLQGAVPVHGMTTYGTSAQRYEAATAMQRDADDKTGLPIGQARYLIDENTGEIVVRLSDLAAATRSHIGGTVPRGWLDARMEGLGWTRVCLDGHAQPGRERTGNPHARCDVYRGFLPSPEEQDDDT